MRWIFIFLVFINLLILVYFWQQQNDTELASAAVVEVPSKAKTLTLLSELSKPLAAKAQAKAAQPQRNNLCYAIGPFVEQQSATHLLTRAAALGFSGKLNTVQLESDKPKEYWVYVLPRASREEALRTLRALQSRNYDSYIITQGEMAEGISLGLFRNKEAAYGLRESVSKLDLPTAVRVMNETVDEYWVEIRESAQLSTEIRERIQAQETELRWEMIECQS